MKTKISFFILISTIICCIPLRIWQYFNNIEVTTGFYEAKDISHLILLVILISATIAILVLSYNSKKTYIEPEFPKNKNIPFGIVCLLCSVGFLVFEIENININIASKIKIEFILFVLYLTLSLLAAIGLIIIGISFINGKISSVNGFIPLFMLPIMLVRLIETYISHINIKNISEFSFIMLMVISELLFFFYFARILSGFKTAKIYSYACFFSALAAIFTSVSALSRFIVNFIDSSRIRFDNVPFYVDVFTGILAFSFFTCLVFSKKKFTTCKIDISDDETHESDSIDKINDSILSDQEHSNTKNLFADYDLNEKEKNEIDNSL